MRVLFAFFVCVTVNIAGAADHSCDHLIGFHRSVDQKHSSLQIVIDASSSQLKLIYDQKDPVRRIRYENYILDGSFHKGDGLLTGDSYSVKCHLGVIELTRVLAKFKGPLHTTLAKENRFIVENATMDNVPNWHLELGRFTFGE